MPNENKDQQPPVEVKTSPGTTMIDSKVLAEMQTAQLDMQKKIADMEAKSAGLEAMFSETQGATDTTGQKKLRERKNFEPAFRTCTLKKYPIAGDVENLGIVVGWDNRAAYQKVDKSGVAPVVVDYLNIFFLGRERNAEGKLQAEAVPLLSLLNAPEVTCKIVNIKDRDGNTNKPMYVPGLDPEAKPGLVKEPTGEEIRVTTFDPKHGLMETGETIDGWVGFTPRVYVLQIPGVADPVEIDEKYINA